jgi:hypothetical protein
VKRSKAALRFLGRGAAYFLAFLSLKAGQWIAGDAGMAAVTAFWFGALLGLYLNLLLREPSR